MTRFPPQGDVRPAIYGVYSHLVNITFVANTDRTVPFDTNGENSGITHSESVDNDEFTFPTQGVYQATIEPQTIRVIGASPQVMDSWVEIDTGSGFAAIPNTNIKRSSDIALDTGIAPLTNTFRVEIGDKIRFSSRSTSVDLRFEFTAAVGNVPNTPAAILNIVRIGD
jgi:hypothetical protein